MKTIQYLVIVNFLLAIFLVVASGRVMPGMPNAIAGVITFIYSAFEGWKDA